MKFEQVLFFGDSITVGYTDNTGFGWPARLCQGLECGSRKVTAYNLGVNGDTSIDIAARWRREAEARRRAVYGLLVFAFGINDAARRDGGGCQVDVHTSVATARLILTEAKSLSDVLWIGPTSLDDEVKMTTNDGVSWEMRNADVARYDQAYAKLADEINVSYLPLLPSFVDCARFRAALLASDRIHPADDGYGLIAERVSTWDRWRKHL